jgi:hypothetical protein
MSSTKKDVVMEDASKDPKKEPIDEWKIDEEEMSEEDKQLKSNLDMLVERL